VEVTPCTAVAAGRTAPELRFRAKATTTSNPLGAGPAPQQVRRADVARDNANPPLLRGNQLIQAPDYNASLGVDWRFARIAAEICV